MTPLAPTRGVRIRPGRVLVHVACLATLLLGACSPQPVAPEPYTPYASPVPTSPAGCGLQSLPAAWLAAQRPTALTPASNVTLLARDSTTGRALYARFPSPTTGPSPTTVSVVEASGAERKLFDLAADEQAFGGAIEGGWAVLTVGSSDGFTVKGVYARRVTGGSLITVAARAADLSSGPISETPILYRGVVYLQTGSSTLATSTGSLLAVDLEGGRTRRQEVPRQVSTMARWGDALVWTSTAKAPVVVSLSTMSVLDVPGRLASLSDAWWVSSDGLTLVWEGNGATSGWLRSARVEGDVREVPLPTSITNPGLTSWGRYATVLVNERHMIVDVETGQYAPLTSEWGGAIITGGMVASSELATAKGGSAGLRELDLTAAPSLPACTR